MMDDNDDLIRGSDNVFRDLGLPNPEIEQVRALLAAQIIRIMDEREITVRRAEAITGIAAADFSRIRNAKLDRFTIDRLMRINSLLGQPANVRVTFPKVRITRARDARQLRSRKLAIA